MEVSPINVEIAPHGNDVQRNIERANARPIVEVSPIHVEVGVGLNEGNTERASIGPIVEVSPNRTEFGINEQSTERASAPTFRPIVEVSPIPIIVEVAPHPQEGTSTEYMAERRIGPIVEVSPDIHTDAHEDILIAGSKK